MDNRQLLGRVWPAYSKPKDDELLSSWLVRLAMAHGLKLHTFCSMAWPRRAIWNRDIDKSADDGLIEVLSEKTDTPLERARGATLAAYEGVLYERHNPHGNTPWIMPVGVYHRVRRHFGLQFCPLCLSEDKEPYFRRRWRLAFVTLCVRHWLVLWDRCPWCDAPVNFHRDELGVRGKYAAASMTLCHACKFDLRDAAAFVADDLGPDVREVEFQERLLAAIQDGWTEIPGHGAMYSHLYFRGLHQLMRLAATGRKAESFRAAAVRRFGIAPFTPVFDGNSRDLERLDVAARCGLLAVARHLLEDWPKSFVDFCRVNRVWSSTLLRDLDDIPFWYWRVINEHLYRASYQPSDEEIDAAVKHIHRRGMALSQKLLSQSLGVTAVLRKRKSLKPHWRR